jgi:hypothetical protein
VRRCVELLRMKRKAKSWLALGALVVVAGFAGLNVFAFNHAEAMLHFSNGGPPRRRNNSASWPG